MTSHFLGSLFFGLWRFLIRLEKTIGSITSISHHSKLKISSLKSHFEHDRRQASATNNIENWTKLDTMKGKTENELNEPLLPPPIAPIEDESRSFFSDNDVEAPVVQHVIRAEVVENESSQSSPATMPILMGHWRDDLCSCCSQGCCHPSLVCSACFPLGQYLEICFPFLFVKSNVLNISHLSKNFPLITVAIAQVMTRLNLSIIGTQTSKFHSKLTFFFLFVLTIAVFILCDENIFCEPYSDLTIGKLAATGYSFIIFILVFIIRRTIRRKYQIPHQCCGGMEDCCVAAYCPCLGISQMMRHTTDYSSYRAVWISSTGVPDGAPPVVI